MAAEDAQVRIAGRYAIHGEIASGGMATVHLGRLLGAAGFARTVAIKRMHADLAKDPEFVAMFVDEARLAARIHHPNVASTLDVVALSGELFVVMEYVHGESLSALLRAMRASAEQMPVRVALRIASDALAGLHAAHDAQSEAGEPLGIVHRDVSPQNVLVGPEGIARIIDFGVAKAAGRLQTTREGQIKGKISYMSPEQLLGERVDRRSDVYSASVLLWEMLAGTRLFQGDNQGATMQRVLGAVVAPPSAHAEGVPPAVDAIVLRGLARDVRARFETASEMAAALEAAAPQASAREVGGWVKRWAGSGLQSRARLVSDVETARRSADGAVDVDASPLATESQAVPGKARLVVRSADSPTSTTISASMSAAASPPTRRGRRGLWVGLAVLGAAAAASIALLRSRVSGPPAPSPAPSVAVWPAANGGESPAPEPSTMTSETPSAVAASSAMGDVADSGASAIPRNRTPAPRSGSRPAGRPAANCDPPFVVDERGVRTYKRECVTGR